MRLAAIALLLAVAPTLWAQGLTVEVEPVVEGKAEPGKDYTLKLRFTVPDGYHAYHKDNPGYSLPVQVKWKELAGLELVTATWPEPRKHKDDFSEEWELSGTFDIAYTFKVPANAKGNLTVTGSHDTQFCDAEGCLQAKGNFTATIEVAESKPEPGPVKPGTAPKKNQPEAKATASFEGYHLYHKDNPGYGLPPQVAWTELSGLMLKGTLWPEPIKHDLGDGDIEWEYESPLTLTYTFTAPADAKGELPVKAKWEAQICDADACFMRDGEVTATLSVETPAEDKSATNSHGFFLDFDYALEQAKKLNKPLLVDFNGRNCGPCRKMEATVFTLPEVHELMQQFVIASVQNDIDNPRYNELWEKYRPSPEAGVPYYAVMDHEAKVLRGIASTLPARERSHEFVSFLKGEAVKTTVETTLPPEDAKARPAGDWPDGLFGPPTALVSKGMDFRAGFATGKIKPGGEVTLDLHFTMKGNGRGETYHAYHPGTKATDINIPLSVLIKDSGGLVGEGEWMFPAPASRHDDGFGEEWLLGQEFTVVHKFKVPDDLKPGVYRVTGHVNGQYCDSQGCIFFNVARADALNREFGWFATIEVAADGVDSATTDVPTAEAEESKDSDALIWLLLAAFGAGIITLLTPCVLPVLPLTIGFFVSQSSKGKSPLLTAFIYCTCIVATFTLFGLITSIALGATGAQNISTNGYVNTFLALMFLVFALSFLGLFELRVPNFVTQWFTKKQMGAQQEGHGYAKAFFSGSAFSLISFSCTGPIAGTFLAQAATGSVWVPTLAMLAFSSGMALPIFIMGQFPSLLKKMPKSGGWMNAMKVVFGFIEIGLAIMYLSAAEQAFRSIEAAEWVNRYVVLAVWASVSVASALYLFGVFRMPHDHEETKQIGVIRSLLAVSFLAFAVYMVPGIFGAKYGNVLEGILPPPPADGGIQIGLGAGGAKAYDHHDLPWHKDFDVGLAQAKAQNKPIFLDFTGYN
jgi:thiol:disulfide interchange protein